MINSAKKGKRAEQKVAKQLRATRKAGPDNPDLKKGKDRMEVKNNKNPLNTTQLKSAYAQNHASIIISAKGFTEDAIVC